MSFVGRLNDVQSINLSYADLIEASSVDSEGTV